ncbi:UNVERIFIED_CONTAM: hypothetical protein Sradi_3643400 [Sesamum radiatum]|uniref:DUF4216 domain-containing protein n=1 Tax=Sesamum radiatum TaxID=300843 RepID=A0AAW2QI30_SESRA
MPPASYSLSHDQKKIFCDFLSSVKFPDAFASNISRCVKEKEFTISDLKSHDCHVLLQRLLPFATRGYLHKEVEARLTGPVQYRWMFPFESEHIAELVAESGINVEQRHDLQFPRWFRKRVEQLHFEGLANDELISLANGPDTRVKHYTGCNVNGFRFHTKDRENNKKTQNSGVVVEGEHNKKIIDFYGVVKDIIEVDYLHGAKRVLIFKCDWWNLNDRSGIQMDRNSNITNVNVCKTWYVDQPFVLAYQGSFNSGDSLHYDRAILSQMNTQNRNYRHKLYKNYFLRGVTPAHVDPEDWEYLCTYFSSEEYQEKNGGVVGPIELYKLTRYKCEKDSENGCWVSEVAKDNYEKMMELWIERQAAGESLVDEEQICAEILGYKSGYIRGRGAGPKPKTSFSKQSYREELKDAKRNARIAQDRAIKTEQQLIVFSEQLEN